MARFEVVDLSTYDHIQVQVQDTAEFGMEVWEGSNFNAHEAAQTVCDALNVAADHGVRFTFLERFVAPPSYTVHATDSFDEKDEDVWEACSYDNEPEANAQALKISAVWNRVLVRHDGYTTVEVLNK